jgi:hypothetical protein
MLEVYTSMTYVMLQFYTSMTACYDGGPYLNDWRYVAVLYLNDCMLPVRTGRLYPRNILVLIFRGWVDPGHMEVSDAP